MTPCENGMEREVKNEYASEESSVEERGDRHPGGNQDQRVYDISISDERALLKQENIDGGSCGGLSLHSR